MSDEKKTSSDAESAFPNPMKMFTDIYNQTLKQTAEQWEDVARSPMFLAAMANNVENAMQMQKQMQEMLTSALQALNLPTKEDYLLLVEKINQLNTSLSEINAKLDRLARKGKSSKAKTNT